MLESRCAMHLTHLSLTNFRNYVRLETQLPLGATLLVGANAQGKTSFLEAVYYLTSAASPHASNDRQLIHFLALRETPAFARLAAELRRGDRLQRIEIRLILEPSAGGGDPRLHKEVLINGVQRRVHDLAGVFNAVLFQPQDLVVIEGPPGERRRFLDSAIGQADAAYADAVAEYGKVLTQRNALLKQLQEQENDADQLEFWDEQMCELGSSIMRARAMALIELERLAVPIHQEMTRGKETLRVEYLPAFAPETRPEGQLGLPLPLSADWTAVSRESIRAGMREALQRERREEIARGMTTLGPQRDEMRLTANGIDLRYYGSRGQNRTAMLSLKLAELEWLQGRTGEPPVLLLDEVLAELDAERRRDMLGRLQSVHQAILTAADLDMFNADFREQATIWHIVAGTIRPPG